MKDRGLSFANPASRVPCKQGHFTSSLLLDFTLVRLLGALGGPLRRVVALYVVLGRSLWTLVSQLVFKFADGLGWLSAPPRNPVLRGVGRGIISVRRWHYTIGKARRPGQPVHSRLGLRYPSCLQAVSELDLYPVQRASCFIQPSAEPSTPSRRPMMRPFRSGNA